MYSVIIADDEERVLRDIEIILVNSGFEYKNIYKVRSGIEAREIIEKDESVRLILSDISMPEFNGIELLEYIKQFKKDIFVILVTGYAKFEYAKRAIDLGVAGFVLKPINEEELCNCISKVHKLIQKDYHSYQKYNIKLVGSIARMLLETGRCTEEEEKYIIETCDMDGLSKIYLAMFKNISDDENVLGHVNHCIEEYESNKCRFHPFMGYDKRELLCLCVISQEGESIRGEVFDIFERLGEVKEKIYIGISGVNAMLLPVMYQQCKDAYYEKVSNPQNHIFFYKARKNYRLDEVLVQARLLEKAIILDDSSSAEACVEKMFEVYLSGKNDLYFRDIYKVIINIVLMCKKNIIEENPNENDELQIDYALELSESIDEAIGCLCEYIKSNCRKNGDGSINIQAVVEYVNCNYMKEITLEETGKLFNIAPNYLSRRFKKKTGEGFVQYINRKRIEKAIELLKETNIKVVTIAEMVGFRDNQYFHKLFKKNMGVTPIEYRMEVLSASDKNYNKK